MDDTEYYTKVRKQYSYAWVPLSLKGSLNKSDKHQATYNYESSNQKNIQTSIDRSNEGEFEEFENEGKK